MDDKITIRNLENHEVFEFDKPIWNLRYDRETMLFSCNDFRYDQWEDNVCGRPLKLASSLFPELDGGYVFHTHKDALYFLNWLQFEAHPADGRMSRVP